MDSKVENSILLIYTGGTIGMVHDPISGALTPFNFDHLLDQVPELQRFDFNIDTISFDPLIDSSEVSPAVWIRLADLIEQNYNTYKGFVILHGTDTMAYSASALSFMLENLGKPVVFTGSQLPIGVLRTDGKENLITALEIAADRENGKAIAPEVSVFFQDYLLRGNRTTKLSTEHFNAFASPNMEPLATAGINIKYNRPLINYPTIRREMKAWKKLSSNLAILKIFPGIGEEMVDAVLNKSNAAAVVLESFGAGNAPTSGWLIDQLKTYIKRGGIVLNVTQCYSGSVKSDLYETGRKLVGAGVIDGKDITTEAALTKLMFLLGNFSDNEMIKNMLKKPIIGEITI